MLRRGLLRRTGLSLCEAGGRARVSVHRSPYAILGVRRSDTPEDIKARYQELLAKHHPDKGGTAEDFQRIREAYEALSTGPPAHMVYAPEKQDAADRAFEQARESVETMAQKRFGISINWEEVYDRWVARTTKEKWLKRLWIGGFCYWCMVSCTPPFPLGVFILAIAYAFDAFAGWMLSIYVSVILLVWTVARGYVPDYYVPVGYHWAFDQPTEASLAFGVPDYRNPIAIEEWKSQITRDRTNRTRFAYKNVVKDELGTVGTPGAAHKEPTPQPAPSPEGEMSAMERLARRQDELEAEKRSR